MRSSYNCEWAFSFFTFFFLEKQISMSAPVIRASTVGPVPTMLTDTAVAANGDFLEQIVKKVIDLIFLSCSPFENCCCSAV